jgi:hypothetical protein
MHTPQRLPIAWVAAVLILAPMAADGQVPDPRAPDTATGPSAGPPIEPWIHPSMPEHVKEKIQAAFEIAIERVREVPECAGLFTQLGADGEEMLKKALYFPAGPFRETTCCRRSLAATEVGGSTTWVCRRVASHCDGHVAVALLHEALHHAGLTEYPHDRQGLCSDAINAMVIRSCGFQRRAAVTLARRSASEQESP